MSPLIHRAKEFAEQISGRHLILSRQFPYLHAERRFLTLRLDLHNKCNLRCRMCYFALDEVWNAPLVELSDAVIERMVNEIWPLTRELWLSCASEPLTSRKLDALLPRAKQAGIPLVQMVTNGLALNERKAHMIVEGGLDRLSVSLDGATAETYEAIRTHSDFPKVLANIRRLQAIKAETGQQTPALIVRAVLMLTNLPEWADIVNLAADLGAERVIMAPQTYYTEFGREDHLWEHPETVNPALGRAREAARRRGIPLEAPAGFGTAPMPGESAEGPACAHCLSPWLQLVLYTNGEVTPCFQMFPKMKFGNLERQHFRQIYFGPAFRRLREELRTGRYGPLCRVCSAGDLNELSDAAAVLQRDIFA